MHYLAPRAPVPGLKQAGNGKGCSGRAQEAGKGEGGKGRAGSSPPLPCRSSRRITADSWLRHCCACRHTERYNAGVGW